MERWDVCDSEGNPTGRTKAKGEDFLEGEYHVAAEIWIFNGKKQFLIQKRSSRCQQYPGVWSTTAGRVQAGETPAAGCIREAEEEIGMKIVPKDLIHVLTLNREDKTHMIWEVYAARTDLKEEEFLLDPEEVEAVRWVSQEEMAEMIESGSIFLYPEIREVFEKVKELL